MAIVTGTLTDIGMGHLVGKSPVLLLTLNAPNISTRGVHPTEPIRIVPNATTGAFSATVAPTTDMLDAGAFYSLTVQWVESDAPGTGVRADWDGWQLVVPPEGGNVGDLWGLPPTNLTIVWVSLVPPPIPVQWVLWLEQNPDDINDPLNTSILYRWEA